MLVKRGSSCRVRPYHLPYGSQRAEGDDVDSLQGAALSQGLVPQQAEVPPCTAQKAKGTEGQA